MASTLSPTGLVGHEQYAAHVRAVALADTTKAPALHVQVQSKGVTFCGQVKDMARFKDATQPEWFKVQTCLGTGWFPCTRLRLCSQVDERCSCEASQ